MVDLVGKGTLELTQSDVKMADGKVYVRVGAKAVNVWHETMKKDKSGPKKHTYCVGLVRFCCHNNEAWSGCVGAYDCSSGFLGRLLQLMQAPGCPGPLSPWGLTDRWAERCAEEVV